MGKLANAFFRHPEDISHDELLHLGDMNTPAATTQLHSIHHEIIMVSPDFEGVCPHQIKVLGCQGGRKGMVCGRESSAASLTGIRVIVGSEKREAGYPCKQKSVILGQEARPDGLVVKLAAQDTQCCGATLKWFVLPCLDNDDIAIFKRPKTGEFVPSVAELCSCFVAQRGKPAQRLFCVIYEKARAAIRIAGQGSREIIPEVSDELRFLFSTAV